jgi:hypothetical protein
LSAKPATGCELIPSAFAPTPAPGKGLVDLIEFAISHLKQNKVRRFPQSFSLSV